MASGEKNQTASTKGNNSPAINIDITRTSYSPWFTTSASFILITLFGFVVYILIIISYNNKQKKYYAVYEASFGAGSNGAALYEDYRLNLERLVTKLPMSKSQWKSHKNLAVSEKLFSNISRSYQPLSACFIFTECEVGWDIWNRWWLCYNGMHDWQSIKRIYADIAQNGLQVTDSIKLSDNEVLLPNVDSLVIVLSLVCKAKFP